MRNARIVRRLVVSGAALALLLGGSVPARAQWRSPMMGYTGMMGGGAGVPLPLLLRAVNLTPDQETRVREIVSTRRTGMRGVMEQLRQAQEELADKLLAAGTTQPADVQPQLQRIAQLRAQLLQESAQIALEIRALLTPEQLAKAAQAKDRLRQLQGEMRQLWQQGRP